MFVSTKDRYVRTAAGLKLTRNQPGGEVVHRLWLELEVGTQPQPANNFGEAI
jgi:hypothetical protein